MHHQTIYSVGGYTHDMGNPFLHIKMYVLAVAEHHRDKLLQQCVERAFSGFYRAIDKDCLLAQAILVQLGLEGTHALLERFREILQTPREDNKEYHCGEFLLKRQLRSLTAPELEQLLHEYFSPCKLSDDPVTAQIQLILLEIALQRPSKAGVLHGLRSMASNLLSQASVSEDPRVRIFAAKLAKSCLTRVRARRLLQQLAEDPDQAVREEALFQME